MKSKLTTEEQNEVFQIAIEIAENNPDNVVALVDKIITILCIDEIYKYQSKFLYMEWLILEFEIKQNWETALLIYISPPNNEIRVRQCLPNSVWTYIVDEKDIIG